MARELTSHNRISKQPPPVRAPGNAALVLLYALSLVGLAVALLFATGATSATTPSVELPWLAIAAGFFLVESAALHIEIRRENHSLSLAGFPLLLGLMSLGPLGLIAARIVGSAVAIVGVRRQIGVKPIWNLSLVVAETAVAFAIARPVLLDGPPSSAVDWLVLLTALLAADLVGLLAVPLAIRVFTGRSTPLRFAQMARGEALALVSSTFAVVVAAATLHTRELLVLGLLPLIGVWLLLRVHGRLGKEHHDLQRLQGFAAASDGPAALDAGLRELCSILRTRGAALVFVTADGGVAGRALLDDELIDVAISEVVNTIEPSRVREIVSDDPPSPPNAVLTALGGTRGLSRSITGRADEPGFILVIDRLGVSPAFDDEEVRLFDSVAATLGTRISADRLLEQLELQATVDGLTGLANRATLERQLELRLRHPSEPGVVAVLDLHRLKDVNDSLGHQFGDAMLRLFADRLREAAGGRGLVARLGGDEFAVVFGEIDGADFDDAVERDVARLSELMRAPIEHDGLSLEVGVSLGFATWPSAGVSGVELLRHADIAMQEAKRTLQPWVRYRDSIDHAGADRLALLGQLRDAIADDQLEIHLQPQVRGDDGRLIGAEALVRWNHPELGMVMPSEFVALAEHSNLAGELTECVINAAARAAHDLRDRGFDLRISVNLTSRDLIDKKLPDVAIKALTTNRLPPESMAFEVTESSVIVDLDAAVANLGALRSIGCRTAVDDFGTGYASLRYLQILPLDEVKIDQSFIAGVTTNRSDGAIVRSTARLIKDLGLEVVAEGVEDEATLAFIRGIGCDTLQGYLVSRPLPVDEFILFAEAALDIR